jgi:ferric-dicitrate binding protein FerR (iron transport regulator)
MEGKDDYLNGLLEGGKLPLTGETFTRKHEVGVILERLWPKKHTVDNRSTAKGGMFAIIRHYWWAAATVAILLMTGGYLIGQKNVTAGNTPLALLLPDGSHVQLNEHSSLGYNRLAWLWKRELSLTGRGFFEVTHGEKFLVRTIAGEVAVQGTKFLVEQEGKNMFVDCKEGKVEVKTKKGKQTLQAGESIHCAEHKIGEVEKDIEYPSVLGYENDPLVNIIADIEQIFHIKVLGHQKYDTLTYEGSILTHDLDATLRKVFGSLKIDYEIKGGEVILK